MNALPQFASQKCCGKCRRYKSIDVMRRKTTPAGGVIYICPTCDRRCRHRKNGKGR